jgi:hypothetical protein
VRANPPHRLVNPEHKTFVFEGPELRRLLADTGLGRARFVYGIGADGYVTMIPAAVVRGHSVLLAVRRDGETLTPTLGEQQVIFPTTAPEPYRSRSAFWTWYARAFVVGELPNRLSIGARSVALSRLASKAAPASYVPPSLVRVDERACPRVGDLALSDVPGLKGARKGVARALHKDAIELDSLEGYRLLASTTGQALPVSCGGPFILVKPGHKPVNGRYSPDDLICLVYGIDAAPGAP